MIAQYGDNPLVYRPYKKTMGWAMRVLGALVAWLVVFGCGEKQEVTTSMRGFGPRSRIYPDRPDSRLTPGQTCQKPQSRRYGERIPYCNRAVSHELKNQIIETYDQELGYHISQLARQSFKIDHMIPLCMGGDNAAENLWPQHQTIFTVTDPFEAALCKRLERGEMLQARALEIIKALKANVERASDYQEYLD